VQDDGQAAQRLVPRARPDVDVRALDGLGERLALRAGERLGRERLGQAGAAGRSEQLVEVLDEARDVHLPREVHRRSPPVDVRS
jgi:hypothetical protein